MNRRFFLTGAAVAPLAIPMAAKPEPVTIRVDAREVAADLSAQLAAMIPVIMAEAVEQSRRAVRRDAERGQWTMNPALVTTGEANGCGSKCSD